MNTDAPTLKSLMNSYGNSHAPFLFGVDYEQHDCFFVENPTASSELFWQIKGAANPRPAVSHVDVVPSLRVAEGFTRQSFAEKFDTIQAGLLRGDSFLANLTVGVEVECNVSLDTLFDLCAAKYKLLLPNRFVCFSPECFVKIADDAISAYPMKGTIDASLPNAEMVLLNDYKEQCEHNTIVDLLRNDLSIVADDVTVTRFRYVDRIATHHGAILQTSSQITGRLSHDWHSHIGDIIFSLLPAGSICGAPKPATLRLINTAERSPRGWYTGVFGYYDGESLDTAVMIRCIAVRDGKLYFHSGGGITVNSNVDEEFNEVLQKIYLPI